ncbi:MAG: hypothetical protein FWB86_07910 [Treponema sp.]|nr:hypothetical protein [Treponema sp.]MCL2252046.1 hypothetical protein [Treponema sp.]
MKKNVFLVLVPHTDIRVKLRKYTDDLIKNELTDVYDFPLAVPIAALSNNLTADELKQTAQSLRQAASVLESGRINITEAANIRFPVNNNETGISLYGYRIDLNLKAENFIHCSGKITSLFSPLVIGAFLKHEKNSSLQDKLSNIIHMEPQLFFRAAAIANMYWKPFYLNEEICYKWKIGKLSWLPRKHFH